MRPGYDVMTINVLLIEDDPNGIALVKETLGRSRDAYYEVETCKDLSGALERLSAEGIDATILSSAVSADEEIETARKICAEFPSIPVIALAGDANLDAELRLIREGEVSVVREGVVAGLAVAAQVGHARPQDKHARQA